MSIALDLFKNPNFPLGGRVSLFSPATICSPNSETIAVDDDVDVAPMLEERLHASIRVKRVENTRLVSVGASVNVSADERGELSGVTGADAGRWDTTSDLTERLSQCASGMGRPHGDDGADSVARERTGLGTCSAFS